MPPPETTPVEEVEEEADLGPLPAYIVDPDRPFDPTADGSSSGSPSDSPSPFAELGIRPAVFPVPETSSDTREDSESESRRPRRTRPQQPEKRSSPSAGEPGDEAEEVGWMHGLSNRLSAYSLSGEDEGMVEGTTEPFEDDAPTDDDDA